MKGVEVFVPLLLVLEIAHFVITRDLINDSPLCCLHWSRNTYFRHIDIDCDLFGLSYVVILKILKHTILNRFTPIVEIICAVDVMCRLLFHYCAQKVMISDF